jgi:hypothetical protein
LKAEWLELGADGRTTGQAATAQPPIAAGIRTRSGTQVRARETSEEEGPMVRTAVRVKAAVLISVIGFAGSLPAAAQTSRSDQWDFMLAPYLWASGLSGDSGILGQTAEVDLSFSDIADMLDGGALAHFEAQHGKWMILGDAMFLDLGKEFERPEGEADFEQWMIEAAGAFRIASELSFLFGARYNKLDAELEFSGPLGVTLAGDQDWTDGFVGLLWRHAWGKKWGFSLRGDVGAGGSDLTWHARGAVLYRASEHVSIGFGYRHMDIDFEDDEGAAKFTYDVALSGAETGIAFHF